eukprot:EG_transcript_34489
MGVWSRRGSNLTILTCQMGKAERFPSTRHRDSRRLSDMTHLKFESTNPTPWNMVTEIHVRLSPTPRPLSNNHLQLWGRGGRLLKQIQSVSKQFLLIFDNFWQTF